MLHCKIINVYVLSGDAAHLNAYPYCTVQPKDSYYCVMVSYHRVLIPPLNRVVYLSSRLLPNHEGPGLQTVAQLSVYFSSDMWVSSILNLA